MSEPHSTGRAPITEANEQSANKRALVQGLRYAHIGFVLPISVIAGWLLGGLFDKWLGTHWIYLAGLGLGIVAGFFDIIRTVIKMGKNV